MLTASHPCCYFVRRPPFVCQVLLFANAIIGWGKSVASVKSDVSIDSFNWSVRICVLNGRWSKGRDVKGLRLCLTVLVCVCLISLAELF